MADEKELNLEDEKKQLSDEELNDVSGGFFPGMIPVPVPVVVPEPVYVKPRPNVIGTCNECAIKGNMNATLYGVPGTDIAFCLDEGHIFRHGCYDHTDKNEARGYF